MITADEDLLRLTQWLSPAFPIGGFAYSHGLETAIAEGQVTDAGALLRWMTTVVPRGTGRADAILLVAAMAPDADHAHLTRVARAMAASSERWEETLAQGAAFTSTHNSLTQSDFPGAPLPVAVGRAAQALTLPAAQVAALYLHSFCSNLISGAVRFVPLGQTDGQRVLADLHDVIHEVADAAVNLTPDDITTSTPGADLAAMRHESLDVRIFKS